MESETHPVKSKSYTSTMFFFWGGGRTRTLKTSKCVLIYKEKMTFLF